ncbi:MAG: NADH-ubiquinone oxidoreductase-F iron-sulfur binding region domain-containing protein [Chitinivorax sp.]
MTLKSAPESCHDFYHLQQPDLNGMACRGLACFAARADMPQRWQQAQSAAAHLYCLGQCYCAPALAGEGLPPAITAQSRHAVLLGDVLAAPLRDLAAYQQAGGGQALRMALVSGSAFVIEQIAASGLRGRGGAGFAAAKKWAAVAAAGGAQKYVVANADEGDPGGFSDKVLLEQNPFLLIEAMLIAGIAVGASKGYIYLRREYPAAGAILRQAIQQAQAAGWLGASVLGSSHDFELQLVVGHGSYLCGEETAMLNAIEGQRPEVRLRPPQITEHGLFGQPTLVNNVETLCAVPWIIQHGGAEFAALGTADSKGTKLLSLNSLFNRPGLYEVEFGITIRQIVDELGGGLRRGQLKGVMIGGPLAGIVPPALLDTPLDYEALHAIGCAVGHGGVIAFADDSGIAEIVAEVFRFGASESCGKCTPCHLGSPELARSFAAVLEGQKMPRQRWRELIDALANSSLCGHGRGLAEFALAIERHYPEELAICFV